MVAAVERLELAPSELRRRLDPTELPFETTEELEPLEGTIGQPRALSAIEFGLEIETFGYNLYASGAPGSGRESTVRDDLERLAPERPAPDDWVYVHNFDAPDRPAVIRLPAGRGRELEKETEEFVEAAKVEIPAAFEGEEYQRRRQTALAQVEARREALTEELGKFADERGYALEMGPAGIAIAPVAEGRPLSSEEVEHLSDEEAASLEARGEEIKDVNLFVDHSGHRGAPVVIERNPTYYNLIGRVDYRATFGAMVTDFRQIKPGALHRAHGGFLVLHLLDVLRKPFAYEALKRCLRAREVRIEKLAEQYSPVPTATLRPAPIEIELKVIVIGPLLLYHLLSALDEDFRELFKVKIDFAPEMDWNDEHVGNYAGFISRCVRTAGLRHFDRSAIARVIEHGARLREHQGKLSTRLLEISDVVAEASFWAGKAGRDVVVAEDVDTALAEKDYRSNLLEERIQELIGEGTLLIDVDGERPGQVNGLSLAELGDYRFGRPTRVTARVSLGRGTVESIEREIELSGPVHSKGFLILSGYLAQTYAQDWPLALKATIAFRAVLRRDRGRLCLLDRALRAPVGARRAAVASGHRGHRLGQPARRGAGGRRRHPQGRGLLRRQQGERAHRGAGRNRPGREHEAPDARRRGGGRGRARGVPHLGGTDGRRGDLLTGTPAGERDERGAYPQGTVHGLAQERLRRYADRLRAFASPDGAVAGDAADVTRSGP